MKSMFMWLIGFERIFDKTPTPNNEFTSEFTEEFS